MAKTDGGRLLRQTAGGLVDLRFEGAFGPEPIALVVQDDDHAMEYNPLPYSNYKPSSNC